MRTMTGAVVGMVIGALCSVAPVGAPARPAGADTVVFPSSPIGISGYCTPLGQRVYSFRLTNVDSLPLQLSVSVTGPRGGTVMMSPNPVPVGGSSSGSITMLDDVDGDAVTSVNFLNPEYSTAPQHTVLHHGLCTPSPTVTEPLTTPPQAVSPVFGAPPGAEPAPETTPAPTTAPPTDPTTIADSTTTPVTAATAPSTTAGPDGSAALAVAAAPVAASDGASTWWWVLGAGLVLGVAAAAGGWWWLRRRPTG